MSVAPPVTVEELRDLRDLSGVPDADLAWLAERVEVQEFDKGDRVLHASDPAHRMWIMLEGSVEISNTDPNLELNSFILKRGDVSGRLPYSRVRVYRRQGFALTPLRVAYLPADRFHDLVVHAPGLAERLVHLMLDRTRMFTRASAQREKLIGLGTMAAGLAHELNNPASAARRSAQELGPTIDRFGRLASTLLRDALFGEAEGEDDPFRALHERAEQARATELDPLERSDREDELGDWLEDLGAPDAWDAAAVLVASGFDRSGLEAFAARLPPGQRATFVDWLAMESTMRHVGSDLAEATERISGLVSAMKSYTYMDQSEDRRPVDVAKGIRDTFTILGHKIRDHGVTLEDELPELPPVPGFGSELNQVWTNLIDNAVVAAGEGGGTVRVRAQHFVESDAVVVEICDDGPGVPAEIQQRIFEPFYTTKGVGEGTGMGLDIANRIVTERHYGSLEVESQPGDTRFRVRLPLS